MRNIKLIIEYDGTNYYGWQVQPGQVTIQEELQKAIKRITGEDVTLRAAGRTDAGVHAIAQVANFRTESKIPPLSLLKGLNSLLPDDIVIKGVDEVDEGFDARRSARSKTYKYLIFNSPYPSAIYRRFSWHVSYPLDIELMRQGASLLVGEKDFSSFRASGCASRHAVRTIDYIGLKGDGELIGIEVRGRAFLRHMVRIMVGTLVELGRGRIGLDDLVRIIEARDRCKAPITAPARGLFLKEVEY